MTVDVARAVRIPSPGQIEVVPSDVSPPGPGLALVRVAWAGICGSDREVLDGTRPAPYVRYPVLPGHEWSGTVESVGRGVDGGLTGSRVVGEGFRSCLRCPACRRGETTLCETAYDETGFTQPGAWADFLTLPARLLHVLPRGADLRAAALLEPAACVAEACLRASPVAGERFAVVGGGTVGLLAAQLLRAAGANVVLVHQDHRRDQVAAACGVVETLTAKEATSRFDGFDGAVEAAGGARTAQLAVDLVRRGGRVALVGVPPEPSDSIKSQDLVTGQVTLHPVFGAPTRAWVHAVRAFGAGLLEPSPLVTHEFDLEDVAKAFGVLESQQGDPIKVLLRP